MAACQVSTIESGNRVFGQVLLNYCGIQTLFLPLGLRIWHRVFTKCLQVILEYLQCHGLSRYLLNRQFGQQVISHSNVTDLTLGLKSIAKSVILLPADCSMAYELTCEPSWQKTEPSQFHTLPVCTLNLLCLARVISFAIPVVKLGMLCCRPLQCWLKAQCLSPISQTC